MGCNSCTTSINFERPLTNKTAETAATAPAKTRTSFVTGLYNIFRTPADTKRDVSLPVNKPGAKLDNPLHYLSLTPNNT
jgi:hypothetical protein